MTEFDFVLELGRIRAGVAAALAGRGKDSPIMHDMQALLDHIDALHAPQAVVPEGWKLVPLKPTVGMFAELTRKLAQPEMAVDGAVPGKLSMAMTLWALGSFHDDYAKMLAAAPQPAPTSSNDLIEAARERMALRKALEGADQQAGHDNDVIQALIDHIDTLTEAAKAIDACLHVPNPQDPGKLLVAPGHGPAFSTAATAMRSLLQLAAPPPKEGT